MKKITKTDIFIWVLSLLPLALVAVLYGRLPDEIPMHWGFDGAVAYDAKWQIWIVSGLAPVMAALFRILPQIDPKKHNYEKFMEPYLAFQIMMMLFMLCMVGVVLLESFRPGTVDVGVLVTLLLAVLFIVLGNMMPKFRLNFFCGIKNPWTLSNDRVWMRTHRLGGRLFFAAGVLLVPSILLPGVPRFVLLFALALLAALVPNVMSYIWFRREQEERK